MDYKLEDRPLAIAFHPVKKVICVSDILNHVDVLDLASGQMIHRLSHDANILAIGFTEDEILGFDSEKKIVRWDLNTFESKSTSYIDLHRFGPSVTTHALFVPNESILVVGEKYESFAGPYSALFQIDSRSGHSIKEYVFDYDDIVVLDQIAVSNDGKSICASCVEVRITSDYDWGHSSEVVVQWNLKTCEKIVRYECDVTSHARWPRAGMCIPSFSPEGDRIAVFLNKHKYGYVSLWENSDDESIETDLVRVDVSALQWSPCGDWMAFGKPNGSIALWGLDTRKTIFEEKVFENPVQHVEFSADGKCLATFSNEPRVRIYEIDRHDANLA